MKFDGFDYFTNIMKVKAVTLATCIRRLSP